MEGSLELERINEVVHLQNAERKHYSGQGRCTLLGTGILGAIPHDHFLSGKESGSPESVSAFVQRQRGQY